MNDRDGARKKCQRLQLHLMTLLKANLECVRKEINCGRYAVSAALQLLLPAIRRCEPEAAEKGRNEKHENQQSAWLVVKGSDGGAILKHSPRVSCQSPEINGLMNLNIYTISLKSQPLSMLAWFFVSFGFVCACTCV